jgi:hypothetical protein
MSLGLGTVLVCAPLFLILVIAYAIRETPVRSLESARFEQEPTPLWASLLVVAVATWLYVLGDQSRTETLYFGLVLLSVFGAGVAERSLLATVAEITYSYVNPDDWPDGRRPAGPRWRYQMKARYIHDPEWVDRIALEMVAKHPTYRDFCDAVASERYPPGYEHVLHRKLWGPVFPTVADLLGKVATEVFDNDRHEGRFKSKKTPDQVYAELHEMVRGDRRALMDRWQYYWCLRNLNLVDSLLARAHGTAALAWLVLVGALCFGAGVIITSDESLSLETVLRAEAAGALFWLLLVCGGASIMIVGVFRGTGTFSIARPTRGSDFDPLWTRVIQVGILAFAVSFLVYGIGFPFLLEPSSLDRFDVDTEFLLYAAGSFLFCFIVFLVHTFGVHNLMRASRNNALDRTSEDLGSGTQDDAMLDHFKDVRGMRVWPLRSSTVFQLAGGILLPVGAQAVLIYSGLN